MAAPVLVVDFGSQVTQLIARRVREAGVYCEIVPYNKAEAALKAHKPEAIILSGGPASVMDADAPRAPQAVFDAGVPVLGICYGEMAMAEQLGGKVEGGHTREFGRSDITIEKESPLLEGLGRIGDREPVWMNHGDKIVAMPPGFAVVATSEHSPYAVIADEKRKLYGIQFHPEVVHTPRGAQMYRNFVILHRRHQTGMEHARVPRGGGEKDPRPGGPRQGDLRSVGRRGFPRSRRS